MTKRVQILDRVFNIQYKITLKYPTGIYAKLKQTHIKPTELLTLTLMRCLLTHFVKVFFCTLSRSSEGDKNKRERREVNYIIQIQHGCCTRRDYPTNLCRWCGHTDTHKHIQLRVAKQCTKHPPQRRWWCWICELQFDRVSVEKWCSFLSLTHTFTLSRFSSCLYWITPS